jgi:hypothetical protein
MPSFAQFPSLPSRLWGFGLVSALALAGGCRGVPAPSQNIPFPTDAIVAKASPADKTESNRNSRSRQERAGEFKTAASSAPAPVVPAPVAPLRRMELSRLAVPAVEPRAHNSIQPDWIRPVRSDDTPDAKTDVTSTPRSRPILRRPKSLRLVTLEEPIDDIPFADRNSPLARYLKQKGWYPATFESANRARFRVKEAGALDTLDDLADNENEPAGLEEPDDDFEEFVDDEEPFSESDPIAEGGGAFDDPDEFAVVPFTFGDDVRTLCPTLFCDAVACFTWTNALILGASAGGAIAIRENLDGEVRAYTAEHPLRWSEGSQVLRQFGEFSYQVPALFAVYGWSLWSQDEHMHEFSKAVISAYAISAVTTVAIKGITDTHRPTDQFQDGMYGFPSYHAASTFSIAAVADEYYGWPVGLPCYVLAGLVGWSRIDQREHDLSDVVFGSILGFVIGKSVAAAHMDGVTGCQITPYYDPATRALGATFHKRF